MDDLLDALKAHLARVHRAADDRAFLGDRENDDRPQLAERDPVARARRRPRVGDGRAHEQRRRPRVRLLEARVLAQAARRDGHRDRRRRRLRGGRGKRLLRLLRQGERGGKNGGGEDGGGEDGEGGELVHGHRLHRNRRATR
jgi:hypothetical protein